MMRFSKAALVVVVALAATHQPAQACGGFFCNQVPVDQSGERVLFAVNKGTVTAHIQILYQGDAERFAWVVPVPSQPTRIDVGTDQLFTALTGRTMPRFNVEWINNNQCYFYGFGGMDDGDFASPNAAGGGPERSKGVEVLEESSAGPYDYAVIKGKTADSGDAVFQWLADNDYDQPEMSKDIVNTYVAEQHVFVAIKLQSKSSSGDIVPLVMDFPFPASCVPLRLTSIAATEDMDVWVYMLGQHRAVPLNFFNVELNEKKVNWLQNGNNYTDLARDAVDTAAGRGFLTEFAGDTNDMKGVLWKPGKYDTTALALADTPWEFISYLLQNQYPRTDQMRNILRQHLPLPKKLEDKGVTEQQFYNNMQNYANDVKDMDFDPIAIVADIEAKVFAPLMEANELFNQHRYLTRMYTIISPSEMTRDPIFMFNPDLPNVSNWHRATARPYCKGDTKEVEKVVVTLDDGSEITYGGPFDYTKPPELLNADALGGAAEAVQRMYTSGDPEDVPLAKIAEVDDAFDQVRVGLTLDNQPTGKQGGPRPDTKVAPRTESAGCTVSNVAPVTGLFFMGLIAFVGLLGLRRRESN